MLAVVGGLPSQRELAHLAQASNFSTRRAKHSTLDAAQLHADWAEKLARTLGVPLASVAPPGCPASRFAIRSRASATRAADATSPVTPPDSTPASSGQAAQRSH
jgi:hypothetical protein